jgi:hypothetical protein
MCLCSMPSWQSSIESLSDSIFFLNSQEFFSSMQPVHLLNALLAELYRTPQRFCLLLCLLYTALPPRCSTTLRFPSLSLRLQLVHPPGTSLSKFRRIGSALYALAFRTRSVLSHPLGMKPQRTPNLKSKNSCKCIPNHTSTTYKNTHEDIHP